MIPLFKTFVPELPKLNSILQSGALAYGSYTKEFEKKLAEYFKSQYILVTGSFSDAIGVALRALDIVPGDEVIASPMACLASTQPYLVAGMKLRWADVDPLRGTLMPDSVERQVTSKTKAIIHNHFCGYPGYIDEINGIGQKYGVPVIDDGIECFGAKYSGKLIGNCGTDVTIFSLSAVRFCNCIEGGILIFKEKELYDKALLIRDCGIDRTQFRNEMGEIRPECDINLIGYSATMSNINGYIGLQQMENVDELLTKHRRQANYWTDFFLKHTQYTPIYCKNCEPNYWVFGILTNDKSDAIFRFRQKGYYASGVHIRNDLYSVFGKQNIPLPGVEEFNNSFIALPCGWWME